jgi:hypothetical protein
MADHQRGALTFSMTKEALTSHPQVPSASTGTVVLPVTAQLWFQRHLDSCQQAYAFAPIWRTTVVLGQRKSKQVPPLVEG